MGGTNTPYRRRWQEQMQAGREGGYYHAVQGTVERVEPNSDGRLTSYVRSE